MDRADSLVVDPHKWLYLPYDIGCLFVRQPGVLARAFAMGPEYLVDVQSAGGGVNLGEQSLELTRRSRGLKLWLLLRVYGAARLRSAVARGITLAETVQSHLQADPEWEVISSAQLGIITFTRSGWTADDHAARVAALSDSGYAAITSTQLQGRSALRLCTINPRTTESDILQTLDRLAMPY
jgi:glutamate/tyrosine decarboxylase-like PLP-dependent enzyme